MLTASPITRQTVGKTFTIAISVLTTGAVLQLAIVGWAFATRVRDAGLASAAPNPGLESTTVARLSTPAPVERMPDLTADPLTEPQSVTTTPPPAVAPKPTPVPQKQPTDEPLNLFEQEVAQGKTLRERGEMNGAIVKFNEAIRMDPKNPIAISELAATYEKLGLPDKAGEQWKRVYDMGDTAGLYFSLADAKLKASQALAVKEAVKQMPEAPPENGAIEGIAAGASLGLLPITTENLTDDASAKKFTLHLPIKARPKTKVDVRDLVIHVLFYDIVDGQNVVQTSANVSSRWLTPPADWADADTEELAVDYQLPKPDARAAKRENRKYFGYIVRIYYKQQLQSAAADPERLAQQYPPPPILPKEPEK